MQSALILRVQAHHFGTIKDGGIMDWRESALADVERLKKEMKEGRKDAVFVILDSLAGTLKAISQRLSEQDERISSLEDIVRNLKNGEKL